ncbi:hypothetical protein ACSBO6_09755 [Bacillus sp. AL-1R]
MKEYYIVEFILNSSSIYCIWYSNDRDGLITKNQKLVNFNSIEELETFSKYQQISCKNEKSMYDIDLVINCLKENKIEIDHKNLLDIWNITSDIANSINVRFIGEKDVYSKIYNKLFYGSNLSVIKQGDIDFIPKWTYKELINLRKVLKNALKIIEDALH